MSVINQMLVELDRRRASGEERNRIPDHVRALPDEARVGRRPAPQWIAAVLAVALLAAGVAWWLGGRTPAAVPPAVSPAPVPAAVVAPPAPEARETEFIARRLTLELSHVPEPAAAEAPMAPPAINTASVIGSRAVVAAAPLEAPVEKPRPASPVVKKSAETPAAAASAPVEIDKKVRQPTTRQRAEAEYSKGVLALHQGRAADARSAFEAALQIDAAHHGARQALVGTLLDARLSADAMRVLQEGLQLAPGQQGFAMTLARLQMENGDLDAGVQTLAQSLNYPGVGPDYIAFYAGLLQRQNRHVEAIEQFQRALGRRGNVGVWLLGLGVSLEALGRSADAQQAFRAAKASGNLSQELQAFVDQRLR